MPRRAGVAGTVLAGLCLAAGILSRPGRAAEAGMDPVAACARAADDDVLHPLPPGLGGRVRILFGLQAPAAVVARGSVWRCAGGRALVCFTGANLPCGKLDTREALAPVTAWCAGHPGTPVPASVSGHDSLWRWRCRVERAVRGEPAWHLDGRGFAAETWMVLGEAR